MNDVIKEAARNLRKNMTESERKLWSYLKNKELGKSFQRQKPIFVYEEDKGWKRYVIADFVCLEEKLIIEIDGSIHELPEILELDKHKEKLLNSRGYRVVRFTNTEIQTNIQDVLEEMQSYFSYSTSESY